jgi:predicted PurR-regulated permease PerM
MSRAVHFALSLASVTGFCSLVIVVGSILTGGPA